MDAGAENGFAPEDTDSWGRKPSILRGGETALPLGVTSVQSRFPCRGQSLFFPHGHVFVKQCPGCLLPASPKHTRRWEGQDVKPGSKIMF